MIQPVVPAENPLNSLLFLLITLNNFNFSKLRHCGWTSQTIFSSAISRPPDNQWVLVDESDIDFREK